MSVYRRDVLDEEGGEPGRVLASHEGFGLVAISAGQVRCRDQTVHADPVPEEIVARQGLRAEAENPRRGWFARQVEWVVAPVQT